MPTAATAGLRPSRPAPGSGKDRVDEQIGARLAQMRLGKPQVEMARQLRIGRSRLESYETGNRPLRWHIGVEFCRAQDVNPAWLATGLGPPRPCGERDLADLGLRAGLNDRASFAEGVAAVWSTLVAGRRGVPPSPPAELVEKVHRQQHPGAGAATSRTCAGAGQRARVNVRPEHVVAGRVEVPLEFLPGCAPDDARGASPRVVLTHPGVKTVTIIRSEHPPREQGFEILRACFPQERRTDAFLRLLSPRCIDALLRASLQLTGLLPPHVPGRPGRPRRTI